MTESFDFYYYLILDEEIQVEHRHLLVRIVHGYRILADYQRNDYMDKEEILNYTCANTSIHCDYCRYVF